MQEYIPLDQLVANGNPFRYFLKRKLKAAGHYQFLKGDNHQVIGEEYLIDVFNICLLMTEGKYLNARNSLMFSDEYHVDLNEKISKLSLGEQIEGIHDFITKFLNTKYVRVTDLIKMYSSTTMCLSGEHMGALVFIMTYFPEYKFLRRYKRSVANGIKRLNEIEELLAETFPSKTKIGRWLL